MREMDSARRLATAQGAYFAATGLWPIVNLRSFETVTGPKREGWLVKTVGAMIAVTGASLLVAAARRAIGSPTIVLAAGSAAALAAIDVWYAGPRRRIARVYLADAALEMGLLAAWGAVLAGRRRETPLAATG